MPGSAGRPDVKRILIAEDDPTNQFVIRAILVAAGFDVLIRENGEEALLAARSELPDLILLDMMMPVMDGYQTARQISSDPAFDGIPIVALTARAMLGDEERTLDAGCDAYLRKPISRRLLVDTVRAWLERPAEEWMPARERKRARSA